MKIHHHCNLRLLYIAVALLTGNGYVSFSASASSYATGKGPLISAIEYCDSAPLDAAEGIWEFPEDETSVLIKKDPDSRIDYHIILLHTPDCRFNPGDTIGRIRMSNDNDKFRRNLKMSMDRNPLSSFRECTAILDSKKGTLRVKPMKLKFSFRTMWFLPKFWRSIKVGVDNPAGDLPVGLRRTYPESSFDLPIYF